MKISYYCQHVLGIGHFHRSLEICRAIGAEHKTSLILGGPKVDVPMSEIKVFQLPGLKMDREFQNMVPCTKGAELNEVKRVRKNLLISHFKNFQPDIFITELYPFGRKAFRFELDPVLKGIRDGSLPPCRCYCSVRDILVEKIQGREKFEQRVVETLNNFFAGVLIHADPDIIKLDATFGRMADINIPVCYTGFISKSQPPTTDNNVRHKLGLGPDTRLIVATIGGGNVGGELLQAAIKACNLFTANSFHLQIFCGPYSDTSLYKALKKQSSNNISVDIFSSNFPEWLAAADLSISMAGYNTCMNLLRAKTPALVFPFAQNREQEMRALALAQKSNIHLLREEELVAEKLAERIETILHSPRTSTEINLDGALQTVIQLGNWQHEDNHG